MELSKMLQKRLWPWYVRLSALKGETRRSTRGRTARLVRADMRPVRRIGPALLCLCLLAVALHVYVGLFEWTVSVFSVAIVAWSLVPYVISVVVAYATGRQVFGVVPAFLALVLDAYTFIVVRFLSHSSTA